MIIQSSVNVIVVIIHHTTSFQLYIYRWLKLIRTSRYKRKLSFRLSLIHFVLDFNISLQTFYINHHFQRISFCFRYLISYRNNFRRKDVTHTLVTVKCSCTFRFAIVIFCITFFLCHFFNISITKHNLVH